MLESWVKNKLLEKLNRSWSICGGNWADDILRLDLLQFEFLWLFVSCFCFYIPDSSICSLFWLQPVTRRNLIRSDNFPWQPAIWRLWFGERSPRQPTIPPNPCHWPPTLMFSIASLSWHSAYISAWLHFVLFQDNLVPCIRLLKLVKFLVSLWYISRS